MGKAVSFDHFLPVFVEFASVRAVRRSEYGKWRMQHQNSESQLQYKRTVGEQPDGEGDLFSVGVEVTSGVGPRCDNRTNLAELKIIVVCVDLYLHMSPCSPCTPYYKNPAFSPIPGLS